MTMTIPEFNGQWLEEAKRAEKILSCLTDEWLREHRYSAVMKKSKELIFNPITLLARSGIVLSGPVPSPYYPRSIEQIREDHASVVRQVKEQIRHTWGTGSLLDPDRRGTGLNHEMVLIRLVTEQAAIRRSLMDLLFAEGFKLPEIFTEIE